MSSLILASSSPRRKDLLEFLGIPFTVMHSQFPERDVKFEDFDDPSDYVRTIAMGKALTVASQVDDGVIVSADTMVFCDGKEYGKPTDLNDARRILKELRGKTHTVLTAVCVMDSLTKDMVTEVVESAVSFFNVSDEEIDQFVDTSEPLGKAGAYAIQGGAKKFVRSVRGSVSNVVGLPLIETAALLEQMGVVIAVNVREVEERHFTM
ncbi:septum formation protein Maf [Candidatus Cerribacteria bacterium 'Amazon FNV 2010 28 9']|uniref:dTTP/UTP pyrophosphatase n=1 Tax=Candidatus Cerribacteria bacterium 'Amazon FNV 2010 28 9' TaxID=2081795 RepID=A0A317JQ85_9BACT|nr:MAG: septum formation protein Maf [Candidatus Cerribacteria bacterium 'Amazon FNV 2010 28 9']